MCRCKLGYPINKDGTIPQRCHVDWDDGFYPISCKECSFYISEYEDELKNIFFRGKNMDKAILVIDMPSCCDECFALDEYGDYPVCRITQEQKGYTFRTREQKMDKCPLKSVPEKYDMDNTPYNLDYNEDYERGYNACVDEILST